MFNLFATVITDSDANCLMLSATINASLRTSHAIIFFFPFNHNLTLSHLTISSLLLVPDLMHF
jgi:hypothetical protein